MKTIFFLIIILFSSTCFAQNKVQLEVKKIKYREDSVVFAQTKTFDIKADPCSPIIEIGQTVNKSISIGVQVEVLPSKLGGDDHYVSAIAYYSRVKGGEWKEIYTLQYSRVYLQGNHDQFDRNSYNSFMLGEEPDVIFFIEANVRYLKN